MSDSENPLIGPAELVRVPYGLLEQVKESLAMVERHLMLNDMARCQLNFFDAGTISPLTKNISDALGKMNANIGEVILARVSGEEEPIEAVPLPELPVGDLSANPLGGFTGFAQRPPVLVPFEGDSA